MENYDNCVARMKTMSIEEIANSCDAYMFYEMRNKLSTDCCFRCSAK